MDNLVFSLRLQENPDLAENLFFPGIPMKLKLFAITELGGYPDFTQDYISLDFEVTAVNSMRKAVAAIRKNTPDVTITEFNFQSDFRDRSSSLETLMASLQGASSQPAIIVFYERDYQPQFEKLRQRFPVHAALPFPLDKNSLLECLAELRTA